MLLSKNVISLNIKCLSCHFTSKRGLSTSLSWSFFKQLPIGVLNTSQPLRSCSCWASGESSSHQFGQRYRWFGLRRFVRRWLRFFLQVSWIWLNLTSQDLPTQDISLFGKEQFIRVYSQYLSGLSKAAVIRNSQTKCGTTFFQIQQEFFLDVITRHCTWR